VTTHAGRDVIAVAHGGTIRAALGLALGLDPEASLD
jgi:alpha-ribazole phosphatase